MLEWMHDPETNQLYTDKIRNMIPEDVKQFILKACQLAEQGIVSWVTDEFLEVAFKTLKLHRVYLNVLSDNKHNNWFYFKNGF